MYSKEGALIDRRELLRIKLLSLVAESKIIRRAEARTHGVLRDEMARHRANVVRSVTRSTHLAYGFVRGRTLDQMEATSRTEPDWEAIKKMLVKYGSASTLTLAASLGKQGSVAQR
jgi:hypothetical protein